MTPTPVPSPEQLQAQAELLSKTLHNTEAILDLTRTLQRLLTLLDVPEDQAHLREGLSGLLRQLVAGIEGLDRQQRDAAKAQRQAEGQIAERLQALEEAEGRARQERAEILSLLRELRADVMEDAS